MSIQTINAEIIQGKFSNDDLNSIIDAVKFARSRLTQYAKIQFVTGDSVEFTSTRTGQRVMGTLVKMAKKYATVKTAEGLWRVPMNMLKSH